eukprot:Plantae.Rhodophyta-Purpureofilum_apyrenoidigerum.ctg20486.p1 GENE.Plantae.Rhodophyta-Purpureofilum_apyrenoidigerum.ctg20486~~Plantae.Rhodophyta-Purpureofilum_apyrenoidigerum.ctg20486.p1  ORF type:complete len:309 (-),score=65.56 Plantae.Rhodophyta-Purpureofilum_apyrenoidigerum.ctg20486:88-1014(-)
MIMNALSNCAPNIRVIDLSANELTEESAQSIADTVKSKRYLEALLLEENQLKAKGSLLVAQAFSADNHPELETINFTANEIGAVPAVAICNMCMELPTLKRIELNANKIPPSIVEKLKLRCGDKLGEMDENEGDDVEVEENFGELISELTASEKQENGTNSTEKDESEKAASSIPEAILSAARDLRIEMESVKERLAPKTFSRPSSGDSSSTSASASSKRPPSSRRLSSTSLRKSRDMRKSNAEGLRTNTTVSSRVIAEADPVPEDKIGTDRSYVVATISNILIFLFFISLVVSLQITSDDPFYLRPL